MSLAHNGLAYEHRPGVGAPVVFLHAGIADATMWQPHWAAVAARHPVLRLDLRGFGASTTAPAEPFCHVDDVAAVLAERGLAPAHLAASSFGAGVAVELALHHGSRVRSLLLAPPGGSLLDDTDPSLLAFVAAEEAALAAGDRAAAVAVTVDTWLVAGRLPHQLAPGLVERVRGLAERALVAAEHVGELDEYAHPAPGAQQLAGLDVPIHILRGAYDVPAVVTATERLLAALPHATHEVWDDVAHLPSVEQPDRFTDLLLRWLAPPP